MSVDEVIDQFLDEGRRLKSVWRKLLKSGHVTKDGSPGPFWEPDPDKYSELRADLKLSRQLRASSRDRLKKS